MTCNQCGGSGSTDCPSCGGTGTAITGAVRIDYFWGVGDVAEQQAGRMKQPLRVWALWPR